MPPELKKMLRVKETGEGDIVMEIEIENEKEDTKIFVCYRIYKATVIARRCDEADT